MDVTVWQCMHFNLCHINVELNLKQIPVEILQKVLFTGMLFYPIYSLVMPIESISGR